MNAGVFVTGTDTGVGKTLAACALLHALRARGVRAVPMKPIAAGSGASGLNGDTLALLEAAALPASDAAAVTPVLLREPMAPHIAARRERVDIDLAAVMAAFGELRARAGFMVVEGVGGFRVPLGDRVDTVDLAQALALPVVLVVGLRLGCLNHALLTRDAIRASGLPLAGWIANQVDPGMAAADENVEALDERLGAPLLGIVPWHEAPDPRHLAHHVDVGPLLR